MKRTRTQEERRSTMVDDFSYYGVQKRTKVQQRENEIERRKKLEEIDMKIENARLMKNNKALEAAVEKCKSEHSVEVIERKKIEIEMEKMKETNETLKMQLIECKEENLNLKHTLTVRNEVEATERGKVETEMEKLKETNENLHIQLIECKKEYLNLKHTLTAQMEDMQRERLVQSSSNDREDASKDKEDNYNDSTDEEDVSVDNENETSSDKENALTSQEEVSANQEEVSANQEEVSANQEEASANQDSLSWKQILTVKEFVNVDTATKRDKKNGPKLVEYINENNFEETIQTFIQRSAQLLFNKEFFLDSVGFTNGKNRVNLKGTKMLKCLKESIRSQKTFAKKLKKIDDLDDLIRETFYAYKPFIKRNPHLWID